MLSKIVHYILYFFESYTKRIWIEKQASHSLYKHSFELRHRVPIRQQTNQSSYLEKSSRTVSSSRYHKPPRFPSRQRNKRKAKAKYSQTKWFSFLLQLSYSKMRNAEMTLPIMSVAWTTPRSSKHCPKMDTCFGICGFRLFMYTSYYLIPYLAYFS